MDRHHRSLCTRQSFPTFALVLLVFDQPQNKLHDFLQAIEANKQRNLATLKEAFDKALSLSAEEKRAVEEEVRAIMRGFDESVRVVSLVVCVCVLWKGWGGEVCVKRSRTAARGAAALSSHACMHA